MSTGRKCFNRNASRNFRLFHKHSFFTPTHCPRNVHQSFPVTKLNSLFNRLISQLDQFSHAISRYKWKCSSNSHEDDGATFGPTVNAILMRNIRCEVFSSRCYHCVSSMYQTGARTYEICRFSWWLFAASVCVSSE